MAVRGRPKPALTLSDAERKTLQHWSTGERASPAQALRARIVLASAAGEDNRSIAVRLGVWPQTVGKWRARFLADRLQGLSDRRRPGRPRSVTVQQVQAPAGSKRRAVIDAARTVFLRSGYSDASMEEIASLAAVSKQTLYKHFVDKRQLFIAVITGDIQSAELRTHELVGALGDSFDVVADLRRFARQHIKDVTQPHLIQLRRIIIAEAGRFPELGRIWYAEAPARAHATLGQQLRKLARRGLLRMDDPLLAAQYLNWLIVSIPLNQAMFHGEDLRFPERELERYADEGVRIFLAAYGTAASRTG